MILSFDDDDNDDNDDEYDHNSDSKGDDVDNDDNADDDDSGDNDDVVALGRGVWSQLVAPQRLELVARTGRSSSLLSGLSSSPRSGRNHY